MGYEKEGIPFKQSRCVVANIEFLFYRSWSVACGQGTII